MATFAQAYEEAGRPAPPELAELFTDSLRRIRARYPHHEATVETIETHLANRTPTLLEVLVGAWLLNGGVVLKQRLESDEDSQQRVAEFEAILDEISGVDLEA